MNNVIQIKGKLVQSFRFWKSRFEGNDIAYGPIPVANRSPRGDRPDLIVASHSGAKPPGTESALYLGETIYNLVHSRTLLRILLDHVGDEWFHEFETMVLLMCMTQNGLGLRTNKKANLDIALPD
jgi:hypothetical protein